MADVTQTTGNLDTLTHGWNGGPSTRGTWDIVWSCVSTLFVAVWVMMHLNVPARDDKFWRLALRKSKWLLLSLLAPELVMLFATGQWASAKRSVTDMAELGYGNEWTMTHAFFADSGGIMLQLPDSKEFPVTAKQIHWLVKEGHLSKPPKITKAEIWDKSKADYFAKTVTCFQVGWFFVQIIARAVQHLPITLLELATLALLTCAGSTFFFWFFKPLDVSVPTVVELEVPLAVITAKAVKAPKGTRQDTPLDFIEPFAYTSEQMPLTRLWGVKGEPITRIPNDRDSRLHDLKTVIMVAIPTAAFGTFHLIA